MMTRTEQIPFETMVAGMGLDWDWESMPQWMDHLERLPKGVNVLSYVPLNPLLVHVMGLEGAKAGRQATAAELGEMQASHPRGHGCRHDGLELPAFRQELHAGRFRRHTDADRRRAR
jgi:N-acyl-D-aspartate/D-glutamate deacylase